MPMFFSLILTDWSFKVRFSLNAAEIVLMMWRLCFKASVRTQFCWFLLATSQRVWLSTSCPSCWSIAKPFSLGCRWNVWRNPCLWQRWGCWSFMTHWMEDSLTWISSCQCEVQKRQNDFGHDQYLIGDLFEALNKHTLSHRKAYCRLGITIESWQKGSATKMLKTQKWSILWFSGLSGFSTLRKIFILGRSGTMSMVKRNPWSALILWLQRYSQIFNLFQLVPKQNHSWKPHTELELIEHQ